MIHDFETDHAAEQLNSRLPEIPLILKIAFPLGVGGRHFRADTSENLKGIDCCIYLNHGPPVTIDWKLRELVWSDVALEFKHDHDDGRTKLGWVADPSKLCNFFGYLFIPIWTCWFLPRKATQQAWIRNCDRWRALYGEIRSRNRTYWSISCPVPLDVIRAEIGGIRIATPTTLEVIDRYPNGPMIEHWCTCGEIGSQSVGSYLLKGQLGTWYCPLHRPPAPALAPRQEAPPLPPLTPTQGTLF